MLNQSSRRTKKRKEAKEKKLLYSINNIYNNIKISLPGSPVKIQ
jgi:hypothetical protein